ncbi:cytochrome d ubiquinol oxidase subunit II [Halostreptopolyspora alba]|uniref:Cytochrome d ubiquinol oxidase subunit II n=1 Tax=Halostreptopolyspora alba TaxID=2487137 RepID=A0A3N0DYF5_9ACTN|nr:cytochrome d ubiquinol oxidase subunit II [Nocardiopsaceae bacterium YIM 96095]
MEIAAVVLLAGLVVGYFVLAGCDIGLGMLLPHLARTPGERRRLVSAVAPYFLGTEVWLVGAVGVVAGLFPALKHEVIVAQWPVFVAILAGWLWRDAGLWLRPRADNTVWRGTWDVAITAGSWTLALGWGLVVGGLLSGGRPLSPFALACAVTVVALFALRGAAFGAERLVPADRPEPAATAGGNAAESADVAAGATRHLARGAAMALLFTALTAAFSTGAPEGRPVAAAAVAAGLALVLGVTSGLWGPRLSRHTSALAMAAPPVAVALAVELPVVAAPQGTLTLVGYALAPLVPVMILGQVWLYRMLRQPAASSGFFA